MEGMKESMFHVTHGVSRKKVGEGVIKEGGGGGVNNKLLNIVSQFVYYELVLLESH